MHEFSIVQNIIDIATGAAHQNQLKTVSCVEVEVGQASGVVPDALEFAWESAVKDTFLRHASLMMKIIPLTAKCRMCGLQFKPEDIYESCSDCGAMNPEILSGKELRVTAIHT